MTHGSGKTLDFSRASIISVLLHVLRTPTQEAKAASDGPLLRKSPPKMRVMGGNGNN